MAVVGAVPPGEQEVRGATGLAGVAAGDNQQAGEGFAGVVEPALGASVLPSKPTAPAITAPWG